MSAVLPDPHPGQLSEEDSARAGFYALIGRLFYDAPDSDLLAKIGRSDGVSEGTEEAGPIALAWWTLRSACERAFPAVIKQEYQTLFISVGRAPVTLYTSRYASGVAADKYLVRLRQQLDEWGLARQEEVFEVEDHIAGMCDVMRFLISSNREVAEQRRFFEDFVYPGVIPLCVAVEAADAAGFYKKVALFARAFFELEKSAFEMLA